MRGDICLPSDFVQHHLPQLASADAETPTPLAAVQLVLLPAAAADDTAETRALVRIDLKQGVFVTKTTDGCAHGCFKYILAGDQLISSAPVTNGWYLRRRCTHDLMRCLNNRHCYEGCVSCIFSHTRSWDIVAAASDRRLLWI
jgi:hypothetical protein